MGLNTQQYSFFDPVPPDLEKARAQRRANVSRDISQGLICDTPAARVEDPRPSHEAADFIRASGLKAAHQQRILEVVRKLPGLTYREIAVQCGLERHAVARRLPELETALKIHRGEERLIGTRHYSTWWPL